MKTVVVIQARFGSSRLPGKALLSLAGRPLLAHVLERAQAIRDVDAVWLATSEAARDEALVTLGLHHGVRVWAGSEWDVLTRVRDAAACAKAEVVVRLTGDCPFLAPEVCADVIGAFFATSPDYIWNDTARSGYPDGLDCEVFSREALELACAQATDRSDREHVTPWIRRHLRSGVVLCPHGSYSSIKLSVDTPENFQAAQHVHRYLAPRAFSMADTLAAYTQAEAAWSSFAEGR